MNTTTFYVSLLKDSNTSIIINKLWFILVDILALICIILAILMSILFLCIVLTDKTCHTILMILVTNSCFAGFIFTLLLFWVSFFTLYNDLQQIYYQDLFCNFRGYMCYVTCFALIYSYFLQAIHSYITIIYPNSVFWQSEKFQYLLIILTWIAAFIFACPQIATNAIKYSADDQIYQLPLRISLLLCVLYNIRVYGIFTSPPKYHFRIAVTFIEISTVFFMIALFKFTDPVRTSIMKRISIRPNVVAATII
ncbi:unnamed protein product [Adineta steineri]|uniref:G-protein coupled receptors family 1 profile domain-containing protein n=1 Tax=Adineta steineri TaxID=433720 RepID=A0A813R7E7_9BILA|nr:unnamed protein product [Adineta steineri]CAF0907897.1 unnamed protein product [Adineta steineri]